MELDLTGGTNAILRGRLCQLKPLRQRKMGAGEYNWHRAVKQIIARLLMICFQLLVNLFVIIQIMAVAVNQHTELNPLQVSLLRLFNRPMSEQETLELKRVLVKHYSTLLKAEVTRVVSEKGYTQQDFDDMLNAES